MGFDQVSGATVRNVETNEVEAVSADAVFIFVGSDPRTDLVPTIPKDDAGRVVTDQLMQTAVPGLFAVGDVRATPFRQLVVAAGEGAVAANAAAGGVDRSLVDGGADS